VDVTVPDSGAGQVMFLKMLKAPWDREQLNILQLRLSCAQGRVPYSNLWMSFIDETCGLVPTLSWRSVSIAESKTKPPTYPKIPSNIASALRSRKPLRPPQTLEPRILEWKPPS
jgi:hypothetical protein